MGRGGCPTGQQMGWDGHLCPTVLSSLMISSTLIITAFLLFFKERIMTPIYTQLNMLAISREWLASHFLKSQSGLKIRVIQFRFLLYLKQRIKGNTVTTKRHKYISKQNSWGTQNPLIIKLETEILKYFMRSRPAVWLAGQLDNHF